jgi:N-acetylmuramoyl-L-alanine amidase
LRWGALLLLVVLPGMRAYARVRHNEAWARDHFATAERMREALNGRPVNERTHQSYQRVINAYRAVYFGAPTSSKADPSVVAVAETLVEMGRRFEDDKILNSAIAQYKFLRREYPGSKYRFDALFTIGEIYKDDLDDPDDARTSFQEFLHRYPHNHLADDAKQAIAELSQPPKTEEPKAEKTAKAPAAKLPAKNSEESETASDSDTPQPASTDHRSGKLPRVTSIRHWSTPDYTRIAIDLESDVKFKSMRISHPDRIFFDLPDTKLASTLVGKSFDVDDGFLKKIRVAQYQPGRTRVVLEVDDLSDYDAFLIPNPSRLIIDIHGKDEKNKNARTRSMKDPDEAAAEDDDGNSAKVTGAKEESPKGTGARPEPKADIVAKATTLKLNTRLRAGTAPVTSLDVSDQTKIQPDEGKATTKVLPSHTFGAGHTASANKPTAPPVKKVVEADDEDQDSSPVETAKLDAPSKPERSAASGASNNAGDAISDTNSDSLADDDETKAKSPARSTTSRAGSKSAHSVRGRKATGDLDIHEASPTASGDRSLIRALGLKIGKIVIDPGHGGHDTGTIGPEGLQEKGLVLDVGKRLGKLLETRLGAEVVYTRKNDTFIPLETRTAIANQERADLFISIHANSSHDPAARGVETYYLNFTSSPEALEVAARENAVSEKSIHELQDLVKKIALKEKIEESREFAGDVQASLHSGLAIKNSSIRDRGVKKAPFIVLIGANMPSILAEISFVSNPTDEHRLETVAYRQQIAESLYRGVAKYVNGLSGVKIASKMDKAAGQ